VLEIMRSIRLRGTTLAMAIAVLALLSPRTHLFGQNDIDVFVNSDPPLVTGAFTSPFVFRIDDQVMEPVILYFNLVDLYAEKFSSDPQVRILVLDESKNKNQPVAQLFPVDESQFGELAVGAHQFEWDGTDGDDNAVDDGVYFFFIETKDDQDNQFEIDTPAIKNTLATRITKPASDEEVLSSGLERIEGTAIDFFDFKFYELDFAIGSVDLGNEGSATFSPIPVVQTLRREGEPNNRSFFSAQGAFIAEWNTVGLDDGNYTIRLTTVDRAGNLTKDFRVVEIKNALFIQNVNVLERFLDQASIARKARISLDISESAVISFRILDSSDTVVFSDNLNSGNPIMAATFPHNLEVEWDGKVDADHFASAGQYTFEISGTVSGETDPDLNVVRVIGENVHIRPDVASFSPSITTPDGTGQVAPILGRAYSYRIKAIGSRTPTIRFELTLSASGQIDTFSTLLPTSSAEDILIINSSVGSLPNEFDGKISIAFQDFLDTAGNNVFYTSPPNADWSGGEVPTGGSLTGGFIGETKGELRIQYQNATPPGKPQWLVNVVETAAALGVNLNLPSEFDNLDLLGVDIVNVNSGQNGFSADVFTRPFTFNVPTASISFFGISLGSFGGGQLTVAPDARISWEASAPAILFGDFPYDASKSLTGEISLDENGIQVVTIFDENGNDVTGLEVSKILNVPPEAGSVVYKIEVDAVETDVSGEFSAQSPFINRVLLFFTDASGNVTVINNSTSGDDRIGSSSTFTFPWTSKEDVALDNGFIEAPSIFLFPASQPMGSQFRPFSYDPPFDVDVTSFVSEVLNAEGGLDDVFSTSPATGNQFTANIDPDFNDFSKLIDVKGNLDSVNFSLYRLEFSRVGSDDPPGLIRESDTIEADRLGVWDVSQLSEGDYNLFLSVVDNQGNSALVNQQVCVNEQLSVSLSLSIPDPDRGNFSPDFEEVTIQYTVSEESKVTVDVLDVTGATVIENLIMDDPRSAGPHVINWDGRDDVTGDPFPNGTYTFRVTAEDVDLGADLLPLEVVTVEDTTVHFVELLFFNKLLEVQVTPAASFITSPSVDPDPPNPFEALPIRISLSEEADVDVEIFAEFESPPNDTALVSIGDLNGVTGENVVKWDVNSDSDLGTRATGRFNVFVTASPTDGGSDVQISVPIDLVTLDATGIAITAPLQDDIVEGTSGAFFSWSAQGTGREFPPVPVSCTAPQSGSAPYSRNAFIPAGRQGPPEHHNSWSDKTVSFKGPPLVFHAEANANGEVLQYIHFANCIFDADGGNDGKDVNNWRVISCSSYPTGNTVRTIGKIDGKAGTSQQLYPLVQPFIHIDGGRQSWSSFRAPVVDAGVSELDGEKEILIGVPNAIPNPVNPDGRTYRASTFLPNPDLFPGTINGPYRIADFLPVAERPLPVIDSDIMKAEVEYDIPFNTIDIEPANVGDQNVFLNFDPSKSENAIIIDIGDYLLW